MRLKWITGRTTKGGAHARRGEAGFTLLETVIAMVVMMTVGLGASALFLYSITNNSAAGARSQAVAIAQQQVEQLRSVGWNDPLLVATNAPVVTTRTVADQNNVTVNGVTRPTTKLIRVTVTPVVNNMPWAAASVTITTTRATALHGPY